MAVVEQKFGAPPTRAARLAIRPRTRRSPSGSNPNFVVVFENDKVIHTVVVGG